MWITMLAKADAKGVVESSLPGLADNARVTLEECIKSLEVLSSPDEYSRTKANGGRRIREVEGGWEVLNHGKYRDKLNKEDRKEYQRVWQQNKRAKKNTDKRAAFMAGEAAYEKAKGNGVAEEQAMRAALEVHPLPGRGADPDNLPDDWQ